VSEGGRGRPSLADSLRSCVSHVHPTLVSPACFTDVLAVASNLPLALARPFVMLECRLGEERPSADLAVPALAPLGGREALTRVVSPDGLSSIVRTDPSWQPIHRFVARWADPDSSLYQGISKVWLEFDIGGQPARVSVPSLFFSPETADYLRRNLFSVEAGTNVDMLLIELACASLQGRPLMPATRRVVTGCLEALPPGAKIQFVGVMLPRETPDLRLIFSGLTAGEVPRYLSRAGWNGPADDLASKIEPILALVDYVWLALDAGESIGPRVGLECYFNHRRQPAEGLRWQTFVGHLVERGLCLSDKAEALLSYQEADSGSRHSLHHVKVSYTAGGLLEAKVYLAVSLAEHRERGAPTGD
jgi:hypothetical protein